MARCRSRMSAAAIEFLGIEKSFFGVPVLKGVTYFADVDLNGW